MNEYNFNSFIVYHGYIFLSTEIINYSGYLSDTLSQLYSVLVAYFF